MASGATAGLSILNNATPLTDNTIGIHTRDNSTANANSTGSVSIETGNKTAGTGDSGDILFQTGTSVGGARGSVKINALALDMTDAPITTTAGDLVLNPATNIDANANIIENTSNILPDAAGTRLIGSNSLRYGNIYTSLLSLQNTTNGGNINFQTPGGGSTFMNVGHTSSSPTGAAGHGMSGNVNGTNLILDTASNATADANATNSILIETGNKTDGTGDSGGITLQPGTSAGGTRGEITLNTVADNAKLATQPTGADDLAIATTKYVDDVTSGIPGDLDVTAFSLADNQGAAANVTGLAFANGVTRSAEIEYAIVIDATADLYESGKLRIVQKGASWDLSQSTNGDNSLVNLSITAAGQVQYTTPTYAGFVSAEIKFRATTTSI